MKEVKVMSFYKNKNNEETEAVKKFKNEMEELRTNAPSKENNKPKVIVVRPAKCDSVRIRQWADLTADVLRLVDKGTTIKVYNERKKHNGFYKLVNEAGYVSEDFVEIVE